MTYHVSNIVASRYSGCEGCGLGGWTIDII